jgi:hypothetical protein
MLDIAVVGNVMMTMKKILVVHEDADVLVRMIKC